MFFKAKIGDTTYELTKLTLGGARVLRREFGLDSLEDFNPTNPDHLVGVLYLCLREQDPAASHDALVARVEAMDIEDFSATDPEPENPTVAVDAATEAMPAPDGGTPETIPAPSGNPA